VLICLWIATDKQENNEKLLEEQSDSLIILFCTGPDGQCTYNVTLRRVRATTFVVEKKFFHLVVLRQIQSLFQSELSTRCDLELVGFTLS